MNNVDLGLNIFKLMYEIWANYIFISRVFNIFQNMTTSGRWWEHFCIKFCKESQEIISNFTLNVPLLLIDLAKLAIKLIDTVQQVKKN